MIQLIIDIIISIRTAISCSVNLDNLSSWLIIIIITITIYYNLNMTTLLMRVRSYIYIYIISIISNISPKIIINIIID